MYRRATWSAEQEIRRNPGLRCYNTSEGLLIEGASPVRVKDIELSSGPLEKARIVDKIFSGAFVRKGLLPCRMEDARAVFQRTAQALETLAAIATTTVRSRQQGMDVLDRLNAEVKAMAQDDDDKYAASLLTGSVSMFSMLLAQALHRSTSVDASVALYHICVERFRIFCDAARAKVDTDLLAVDLRTRDLRDKPAANASRTGAHHLLPEVPIGSRAAGPVDRGRA
jgi:hypothetical protein